MKTKITYKLLALFAAVALIFWAKSSISDSYSVGYKEGYHKAAQDIAEMTALN